MTYGEHREQSNPQHMTRRSALGLLVAGLVLPSVVGCAPNSVEARPQTPATTPAKAPETAPPSPSATREVQQPETPEINAIFGGLENDIENPTPEQEAYLTTVGQGIFDDAEGYNYEKDFKKLSRAEKILWQIAALRHLQKGDNFALLELDSRLPAGVGEISDPALVTDIDPTSIDDASIIATRNTAAGSAAQYTGDISIEMTDEKGNSYTPLNPNASAILFGIDIFRPESNNDRDIIKFMGVVADFIKEGKQGEFTDLTKVTARTVDVTVQASDGTPKIISLRMNVDYLHPASKIAKRPAPTVTSLDATFSTEYMVVDADLSSNRPTFSFWTPFGLSEYDSKGTKPVNS